MSELGEVFIKVDGELTNIIDLKKPDYEEFLNRMQVLIAAYAVLVRQERPNDR